MKLSNKWVAFPLIVLGFATIVFPSFTSQFFGSQLIAGAQEPSFDCAKAESSAAKLICADAALANFDRILSLRFDKALAIIQSLETGGKQAEDALRATQRGWISGRDECWKESDLRSCVEEAYLRRDGQLTARYMLEKAVSSAKFQCGNNPANQLNATFFDTTLPSVRLEYGDTVDVGSLTESASGARYEASFGTSLWIKGDEAKFRFKNDEEQICVIINQAR